MVIYVYKSKITYVDIGNLNDRYEEELEMESRNLGISESRNLGISEKNYIKIFVM
jgi:hypothetical protein